MINIVKIPLDHTSLESVLNFSIINVCLIRVDRNWIIISKYKTSFIIYIIPYIHEAFLISTSSTDFIDIVKN